MKSLLLLLITFSLESQAQIGGQDLTSAMTAAAVELSVFVDQEHFEAYEASVVDDEIHISILADSSLYSFGCHFHGPTMACHEESDDGHKSTNEKMPGLSRLIAGEQAALSKLKVTLERRGLSLDAMTSYKVWGVSDHNKDDDHEHGADVWTKANYLLNGKLQTVFIQCHEHTGSSNLACHFMSQAVAEPDLTKKQN
jgi:hypothetical protein